MVEPYVEFGDPPRFTDGAKAVAVCVVAFALGCLLAGLQRLTQPDGRQGGIRKQVKKRPGFFQFFLRFFQFCVKVCY